MLLLRGMLLDVGVFGPARPGTGPPGYFHGLSNAFDKFTAWRKHVGIQSSQKRFKCDARCLWVFSEREGF